MSRARTIPLVGCRRAHQSREATATLRRSFKLVGFPIYVIRGADGAPFLLGGASPDGQRWKFLPLFDSEALAEAFLSVATTGSEQVGVLATWDEVDEVVQTAQRLGCQRVAWSPDKLHMQELSHDAIEDVLRVIQKEDRSN